MSETITNNLDINDFVEPHIQGFQIWRYAGDDPAKVAQFHAELTAEEDAGWCTILYMDERLAVVQWREEFILTLNPDHPLVALGTQEG